MSFQLYRATVASAKTASYARKLLHGCLVKTKGYFSYSHHPILIGTSLN